ncbi:glycoside hydrolase family 16 protein [Chondromyces apiculatus]|uniref:Glucan endo-1,3-beta-glucosidase A1 n=1 Tax=Chondromyces apiculatus DSM 436 TaxID=1192034 RepID=A0A017TE52_9BACT|nr:glycoside hydrolase family 16 protein [Chondromyces apiculatus]EYF07085.1 Glucan endo-1,3-beta-glucosidase A1 [Chondromyces apiculatus DSM 436]
MHTLFRKLHVSAFAASLLASSTGCVVNADDPEGSDMDEPVDEIASELDYAPPAGWRLDWSDEFNGSSLNTGNWTTLNSNWDPVTNNCNFGTGELEYPRAQNVSVSGGKLILSAQRTGDAPRDPNCAGYPARSFYSGRIHSKGKVERRYGKLIASIKVPSGFGMWPAFWTLGANVSSVGWPASGEIDILEWKSTEPTWMKSATHWHNGGDAHWGTGASGGYNLADSFHLYEVEWTANSMIFRLDGSIVANNAYSHNESEFQQNHYILLNLAVGGNWYGDPSPASIDLPSGVTKTMEVEWVRWYQPDGGSAPALTNPSFESGLTGWTTWSPNGTANAALSETYNGAQSGAYHLTHWTNGTPFEAWTYQAVSGLSSGTYRVRAWVRKGGAFNFARLQAKTCGSCAPTMTELGTYGNWTQVETGPINVTGGYLELGLHSNSPANGANFIHMDSVQIIKL